MATKKLDPVKFPVLKIWYWVQPSSLSRKENVKVGIKGLWFVNSESIYRSHEPEIGKSSIFRK